MRSVPIDRAATLKSAEKLLRQGKASAAIEEYLRVVEDFPDEARFIAEDLVAREPWEHANVERFRRALVLAGDPDPDGVIAERLSGDSPFISIDVSAGDEWTPAAPPVRPDPVPEAVDLEEFFARLRADVAAQTATDGTAEAQYQQGLMLLESGALDAAAAAFESAARAPRFRFVAASRLGRICRDRGQALPAIDWFERAAEAPPPTPDDGRLLLYELADLLESIGESSRALAVCMELYAQAGEYRDIALRVDRLAKVQAGG